MAVTIVKKGKLPEERKYQASCLHCGCIFKFQLSDAVYVSDDRDGDALKIKCPTAGCGREVWKNVRNHL